LLNDDGGDDESDMDGRYKQEETMTAMDWRAVTVDWVYSTVG
jgi:hypothetical protein